MPSKNLIPHTSFENLHQQMNRWLSDVWGGHEPAFVLPGGLTPMNVWEDNEAFYVQMEMPGIGKDGLEINVFNRELNVTGKREEVEQEGATYHRRERSTETFRRAIELPIEIDHENVSAELLNGVLTVRLPKTTKAVPKKVEVQ